MKDRLTLSYCLLLFFILSVFPPAQARIYIWQIGNVDGSFGEFSDIQKGIIEYQVPSDWGTLIEQHDPNWVGFPCALYTCCDNNRPQEVRINFCYPHDYGNPTLTVMSSVHSPDPNITCYLEIFKGVNDLFIGSQRIEYRPFPMYSFSLGYIRNGSLEENQIILRGTGTADASILFDALYVSIDDKDTDGDGVSDEDEGDAFLDQAIVCMPLASYDPNPLFRKNIILQIAPLEDVNPYFREVVFLDPNTAGIPSLLMTDHYMPYSPLSFKVEGIGSYEHVSIFLCLPDTVYPSARFYTYQGTNTWQETDFEILDGEQVMVPLTDGDKGDSDGQSNGTIAAIMSFSYPYGLDVHMQRQGCFIDAIRRGE